MLKTLLIQQIGESSNSIKAQFKVTVEGEGDPAIFNKLVVALLNGVQKAVWPVGTAMKLVAERPAEKPKTPSNEIPVNIQPKQVIILPPIDPTETGPEPKRAPGRPRKIAEEATATA